VSPISYILNKHSSSEGYWGSDKRDPFIFKPVIDGIYGSHNITNILEIGFNIGCSATMWMEWHPEQTVKLTAVDICKHKDTAPAAETVKERYGDRFKFIASNSFEAKQYLEDQTFDMAFIDGGHDHDTVVHDTKMALELGATIFVYDDYHVDDTSKHATNGVKKGTEILIEENLIELEKVYHIDGLPSQVGVFIKK